MNNQFSNMNFGMYQNRINSPNPQIARQNENQRRPIYFPMMAMAPIRIPQIQGNQGFGNGQINQNPNIVLNHQQNVGAVETIKNLQNSVNYHQNLCKLYTENMMKVHMALEQTTNELNYWRFCCENMMMERNKIFQSYQNLYLSNPAYHNQRPVQIQNVLTENKKKERQNYHKTTTKQHNSEENRKNQLQKTSNKQQILKYQKPLKQPTFEVFKDPPVYKLKKNQIDTRLQNHSSEQKKLLPEQQESIKKNYQEFKYYHRFDQPEEELKEYKKKLRDRQRKKYKIDELEKQHKSKDPKFIQLEMPPKAQKRMKENTKYNKNVRKAKFQHPQENNKVHEQNHQQKHQQFIPQRQQKRLQQNPPSLKDKSYKNLQNLYKKANKIQPQYVKQKQPIRKIQIRKQFLQDGSSQIQQEQRKIDILNMPKNSILKPLLQQKNRNTNQEVYVSKIYIETNYRKDNQVQHEQQKIENFKEQTKKILNKGEKRLKQSNVEQNLKSIQKGAQISHKIALKENDQNINQNKQKIFNSNNKSNEEQSNVDVSKTVSVVPLQNKQKLKILIENKKQQVFKVQQPPSLKACQNKQVKQLDYQNKYKKQKEQNQQSKNIKIKIKTQKQQYKRQLYLQKKQVKQNDQNIVHNSSHQNQLIFNILNDQIIQIKGNNQKVQANNDKQQKHYVKEKQRNINENDKLQLQEQKPQPIHSSSNNEEQYGFYNQKQKLQYENQPEEEHNNSKHNKNKIIIPARDIQYQDSQLVNNNQDQQELCQEELNQKIELQQRLKKQQQEEQQEEEQQEKEYKEEEQKEQFNQKQNESYKQYNKLNKMNKMKAKLRRKPFIVHYDRQNEIKKIKKAYKINKKKLQKIKITYHPDDVFIIIKNWRFKQQLQNYGVVYQLQQQPKQTLTQKLQLLEKQKYDKQFSYQLVENIQKKGRKLRGKYKKRKPITEEPDKEQSKNGDNSNEQVQGKDDGQMEGNDKDEGKDKIQIQQQGKVECQLQLKEKLIEISYKRQIQQANKQADEYQERQIKEVDKRQESYLQEKQLIQEQRVKQNHFFKQQNKQVLQSSESNNLILLSLSAQQGEMGYSSINQQLI